MGPLSSPYLSKRKDPIPLEWSSIGISLNIGSPHSALLPHTWSKALHQRLRAKALIDPPEHGAQAEDVKRRMWQSFLERDES